MLRRGREVYHSVRAAYSRRTALSREHRLQVPDLPDSTVPAIDGEPRARDTPRHRVAYRVSSSAPAEDVLAVVRFGTGVAGAASDPLCIQVGLQPLGQLELAEWWFANGPVTSGRAGAIRYACDSTTLFGVIELDERDFGGICAATELAYREIAAFQESSEFPCLLRMWNYIDRINESPGDQERYRQFCVGRARSWASLPAALYPAASGIGRQLPTHQLQIYWLASRLPGRAVENPRQVSAYRYPPEHGPASPSFARASMASDGTLFVSGTASIVGHASLHHGDPLAQTDETLRNVRALIADRTVPTTLKVYVREPAQMQIIARRLRELAPRSEIFFLAGDICRKELLLEIECVAAPSSAAT